MSVAEQLRQEGRQEGIEIGIGKGIEKGMEIGAKDKAIRTARKMLMKGMQVDDVVEFTELSRDEVEKLLVKVKN